MKEMILNHLHRVPLLTYQSAMTDLIKFSVSFENVFNQVRYST